MSFMFRSDHMTYCNIYVQVEAAYETVAQLGEMSCVQFLDASPELNAFQRRYVSELCRCAELERKLGIIHNEMVKDDIYIPKFIGDEPSAMPPKEINTYENMIEKWENDIQLMAGYQTMLLKNHQDLAEMHYVLTLVGPILGDVEFRRESLFGNKGPGGDNNVGGLIFVRTGVVNRSKSFTFETMLWRISRGNIYFRTASEDRSFEDPANSGTFVRKVAFLAVCQGKALSTLLEKICTAFHANMYPCPRTFAGRTEMLNKLLTRLSDLDQVIRKSKYFRCKTLKSIGRLYNPYIIKVKKAKAIYHTMNRFNLDITRKCLIGYCWVPRRDLRRVQDSLYKSSGTPGSKMYSFITEVDTIEPPPTFHRNNKFTRGFQALISAYGDSTYRELNPGLYTLITFPFLFAVMFGDFGHGLLLLAFGLWMVVNEKKFIKQNSTNEIWNIFFGGRYVIFMMSLFTMFTGFCYNDFFAKSLKFGPGYWVNQYTPQELAASEQLQLDPALLTGTPYCFGKDPAWALAKNKILNENSLKMKMSIVLGIVHMVFGLTLSLFNHIFCKNMFAILLQFVPEIVFLLCLFGWLVFLIFWKWLSFSAKSGDLKSRPGCAPLILIHFIDMCLMRETKSQDPNCNAYFFPMQHLIQQILLLVALFCVPVLLLGTPIFTIITNPKKRVEALVSYLFY
ncbi:V-type proton ATPase 116 kDa subunit a-like [Hyposmocoma kahamanoa]|uniref:V-type proton ATPase 116 kDa subunit a-like n=1 Tax=Hyposmocoma kahamanoa TaxID=1477025 RepID=UPI000E6D92AB|nr:V-type proton ATPase 116 kDa subunit a-like [Hyposmocoma kahamanoa]